MSLAARIHNLITRTKGLNDIHDDLATVDTVVDAIKAKTDNLPSDPADQSAIEAKIEEMEGGGFATGTDTLEKIRDELTVIEGSGFATGTDTLEKIADAIAAIQSPLSAKERSLLGAGAFKGFQDYFGDAGTANGVKSAYWTEVTNGASPGTITIKNSESSLPVYVELYSGADSGDDAIIHTTTKYLISPYESDITTVHLKLRMKVNKVSDTDSVYFGMGLADGETPAQYALIRKAGNTSFMFRTKNSTSTEDTSLSLSANTWYTFEIRWTTSDCKLYQDDSLVATHTTYIPTVPLGVWARTEASSTDGYLYLVWVQLWAE